MLKKIIIFFTLTFGLFFSFGNIGNAEDTPDPCTTDAVNKITCKEYQFKTNTFIPGLTTLVKSANSTEDNANLVLSRIIQMLMVVLGSVSLLIMTIGAGFIILHGGQDDLLSKGKLIFTSGIIAMFVALSSYYIVEIIRFIIYS